MEVLGNPVPAGEARDPLRISVEFRQDHLDGRHLVGNGRIDRTLDPRSECLEDALSRIQFWGVGPLLDERQTQCSHRPIAMAQRAPRARSHTSAARSVSV